MVLTAVRRAENLYINNMINKLFIVTLSILVSGCEKENNVCGDAGTIAKLPDAMKEDLPHRDSLVIKIISTQKDQSNPEKKKSCTGTAEIGIDNNIINKFIAYNQLLEKELGVSFQNVKLAPHQYEFSFEMIKNEMTKEDSISLKWGDLSNKIDYTPIEIYDKIDNNIRRIPFAKINQEVQRWLESEPRTAIETNNFIDSRDSLKLKSCSKVMDMTSDPPNLNIFCDYVNEGGELTTVTSIPQPFAQLAKIASDNPMAALFAGNLSKLGDLFPMKMTKLKEEELVDYFKSNSSTQFSQKQSDLY